MEQAIAALITNRNTEEAAKSVGVSTKTLLRWQKDPEFQKAYREARRAVHQQSVARLQQGDAVTVRRQRHRRGQARQTAADDDYRFGHIK